MKLRSAIATWLARALLLFVAACSHVDFQYEPAAPEVKTLLATPATMIAAAEAGDVAAVSALVDPEGRKSMILVAHDVAGKKSEAVQMIDALVSICVIALAFEIGFGGDGSEMIKAFEEGAEMFKPYVEQKLALSLFDRPGSGSGPGLLPDLKAEMNESPAVRRPKLAASFIAELPQGCRQAGVIVSYRASILDHIEWDWAKDSKTFAAWKAAARSLHLIRIDCTDRVGLWIMNAYGDGSLKLAVWHYFTPEQWAKLKPKIEKKLQIEDAP